MAFQRTVSSVKQIFSYSVSPQLRPNASETELSRRHLRFDANALGEIAAKACGATRCVELTKLDEGMCIEIINYRVGLLKRFISSLL